MEGVHRDRFLQALAAEGVELDGDFYIPIYESPLFNVTADEWPAIRPRYGEAVLGNRIDCPVATKAAYGEAVWMHYPLLMGTKADLDDIVAALRKVRENLAELKG